MENIFDNLFLEPIQEKLPVKLVEASRNTPQNQRQSFFFTEDLDGSTIQHPGLEGLLEDVHKGDIQILVNEGLIHKSFQSLDALCFDVTPKGFKYYEYLKQRGAQPSQRIEANIMQYLDSDSFKTRHPIAYQKWVEAEQLLWRSDSEQQLTVIGHLCREAMQEFAESLVRHYSPSIVEPDKARTKNRIRSVIDLRKQLLGSTEKAFLDALLSCWGAVSDLVQRQEHGGQREGTPLIWEDGRRVVFQTAIVMFEIDKALIR